MAKTTKSTKIKEEKANSIETVVKAETAKKTVCYLASKANHIIEVQSNGQTVYIQPFGKIKVIKEQTKINSMDAKNLTFVKA